MNNQNQTNAIVFLYCRMELKASQRKMALLLKINQSSVCRIEKGIFLPSHKICKLLEKIMAKSFSELTRYAKKAEILMNEVPKPENLSKNQINEVSYQELSVSDLEYLKAKFSTMAWEMERELKRKTLKHRKTTSKNKKQNITLSFYNEMLEEQQRLTEYLQKSAFNTSQIKKQIEYTHVLNLILDKENQNKNRLTTSELLFKQIALEEMELVKHFREKKAEELSNFLIAQHESTGFEGFSNLSI